MTKLDSLHQQIKVDHINIDCVKVDKAKRKAHNRFMTRELTEFTIEDMAGYFRHFVSEVSSSPLYQSLCEFLAEDNVALGMYTDVPGTQRRPNLLLAALHYSILRDPSHHFAAWFKTVGGTKEANDPSLAAALSSFMGERQNELKRLVTAGATQTNEVGRSALVLPALAVLGAEQSKMVAIVEIGTSAGLNLQPDAYAINYSGADGAVTTVGPTNSTVHIATNFSRSAERLPFEAMTSLRLGERIGVDLNPLDATDEFQARWLCALIWPDDTARFHRLRAALDHAAEHPIKIHQGDAVNTVNTHIKSVPADQFPVVVTTWVLTYLPEAQRRAFSETLDIVAKKRDFAWITMEHPAYANGLPWPQEVTKEWNSSPLDPSATSLTRPETPLVIHRYKDGIRTSQWVATVHTHGHWIQWHPTSPPSF